MSLETESRILISLFVTRSFRLADAFLLSPTVLKRGICAYIHIYRYVEGDRTAYGITTPNICPSSVRYGWHISVVMRFICTEVAPSFMTTDPFFRKVLIKNGKLNRHYRSLKLHVSASDMTCQPFLTSQPANNILYHCALPRMLSTIPP